MRFALLIFLVGCADLAETSAEVKTLAVESQTTVVALRGNAEATAEAVKKVAGQIGDLASEIRQLVAEVKGLIADARVTLTQAVEPAKATTLSRAAEVPGTSQPAGGWFAEALACLGLLVAAWQRFSAARARRQTQKLESEVLVPVLKAVEELPDAMRCVVKERVKVEQSGSNRADLLRAVKNRNGIVKHD